MMRKVLVLLVVLLAGPATAAPAVSSDRDAILVTIERWYEELARRDDGRLYALTVPGYIEAAKHYDYIDTGAAVVGPIIYTSLPATALQFSHEVTELRLDASFAKVRVWERGFFYAAAVGTTYERAAITLFVLEKDAATGIWLILAHDARSVGIPESMKTDPLPDLREAWERRQRP